MAQDSQDIKIGWIGLGEMGLGMATNLQKYLSSKSSPSSSPSQQYNLTVWNRSPGKTEIVEALGAKKASSLQELVLESNVIFTSLANDAAVLSVYQELFSSLTKLRIKTPLIFVETSTIHPRTAQQLSDRLKSLAPQHSYLQCPVFGRPPAAQAGELVWVATGPPEPISRLRPYFESMSKSIIDLKTPDVKVASSFKLIGNFFVAGTIELLAEGLSLAEKTGVDQEAVLKFIQLFFPAPSWTGYSQKMVEGSIMSKEGGFSVDLGMKDVGHIRDLAKDNGAHVPTADLMYQHLTTLKDQGKGSQDWGSVIQVLRKGPPSS
ncbi:hypothetical protein BX616_003450 [Lobosporangium transversale]|uniref:6-phosphogluconate dehydrogenase n=1 Tax=Lobosporangium transversale TaxID=64571 RepID=A0A1Y2GYV3_9FUNG|nr:hypothetical protein BCR41DRAFT_346843 [Lobosporangium transversale]KAF9898925.1 hypothetical protein BX616_003450 [Lobosporangium transversale]ORZ27479.1 hypothetical protein BCR41DRAFT_346843 [Lobosporangium transversale]|eukprot:XP_021885206.1 hypothetical protein BCR41DRAFT_346843 [Lobosporangium transversale]